MGAGAWGTLTLRGSRLRYRNTPSPERYLETDWASADLESAASELEPLSAETSLSERILLGLRMAGGVDLAAAAASTGATAWTAERERAAKRLVERGRLARDGDRIWIPREAWLLADGTISELI
jgi:coproporphyrinogen III oxidase-like Fe-S oxidoreductase